MKRCLYCYHYLENKEEDFHASCSRKIFGQPAPPDLPYSQENLTLLAREIIQSQTAVTGVQPKLSLHISRTQYAKAGRRFTIAGLWGAYILKPPTPLYPQLPEAEDLTMHLAQISRIKTAPHSLIRLASGNLAYVTRRMDRSKKRKLAMEDMCQLTERLTEEKYQGSYEQIAKAIQKYSATPGLDVIDFFELVLFSFLCGNADMHLKNFSLLEQAGLGMTLAPAYDLINTALVNPSDTEEMALTLNGKKKSIKRQDFITAMHTINVSAKQQENIINKLTKAIPKWEEQINKSFLNDDLKKGYIQIVDERLAKFNA